MQQVNLIIIIMTEEKVLNLPMRRKYALEILRGKKVREYRACSEHWAKVLGECNDPNDKFVVTDLKHFDRIHFYPYNNKWFLDVEFKAMGLYEVDDEFLSHFGTEIEAEKGSWVFVIRLGNVISTNLTEEG